jgi:hypothetical protein
MLNIPNPFKRKINDFASVPEKTRVNDIEIPVIPLEKYPEIVIRVSSLIEKIGDELAQKSGKPLDKVIESIAVTDILKYIPIITRVAAEEFFDFAAFLLDIEVNQVKKLGLVDLVRIINRVYEVNQLAEVQKEIKNFMKALRKQGESKPKVTDIREVIRMEKLTESMSSTS